jgi:hypothetical protein
MLELRKAGYDLTYIANEMQCTPGNVSRQISKALEAVVDKVAIDVVNLELARLDNLFIKAYERATSENKAFSRDGIDACVRLMERRAKLLGIDKPTKVANTNVEGDKEAEQVQFYLPENNRDIKAAP